MRKMVSMLCSLAVFMTLFAGMAMPVTVLAEMGEVDDSIQSIYTAYSKLYSLKTTTTTSIWNTTAGVVITTTAKNTYTSGDFTYTLSGNQATVTDYVGTATDIAVPDALDGYEVVSVGQAAFSNCDFLKNITIPDSVIDIGDFAFTNCVSLGSIALGNGVKDIGCNVFANCGLLTSVVLPEGLTSIEADTFNWCASLTNITIPDTVTNIGRAAFWQCHSLENIVIPNGVMSIGEYAFSYCGSLPSIVIPESTISIGSYAFNGSYLLDVYYSGNKKQWAAITVGDENAPLSSAYIHYNTTVDHWELSELYYDSTCTADGWASFTCPCDYETERSIPATGHDSKALEVVAPTCTTEGYTVYTCATCGDTYYDDYTLAGHTFENNVCVGCELHVSQCLASEHKYANNYDNIWVVYQEGAQSITLTFSPDTETDDGFDFIYIYDGNDNLIGTYTGTALVDVQVTVAGDTAKIRLVSDDSMTYYGFAVTDVSVKYEGGVSTLGDINGDSAVNLNDATMLFYYVNGLTTLAENALAAADMNGDGTVNLNDATHLFYNINGLI